MYLKSDKALVNIRAIMKEYKADMLLKELSLYLARCRATWPFMNTKEP